jgi:hypothetical protein
VHYAPGPRTEYTLARFPVLREHEIRVKRLYKESVALVPDRA